MQYSNDNVALGVDLCGCNSKRVMIQLMTYTIYDINNGMLQCRYARVNFIKY